MKELMKKIGMGIANVIGSIFTIIMILFYITISLVCLAIPFLSLWVLIKVIF